MSNRLTRKQAEELAALFGCKIEYGPRKSCSHWRDLYIVCGETRECIGETWKIKQAGEDFGLPWTSDDWVKAFQRISGVSCAELWSRQNPKS